jgi:hypothetical protein
MKLAIVLVINKGDIGNENQIEALKPLIEKQTIIHSGQLDFEGNVIPDFETYYYTIKDLTISHEAKFYQIVPFGVNPPTNLYDIDSYKVFYSKGDEDKIENHPRFFNWGLKRGTDYGADIAIYLEDYTKLSIDNLIFYLNTLIDVISKVEYAEDTSGKYATNKLLKEVGQLDETKDFNQSIIDYKTRIAEKGLEVG